MKIAIAVLLAIVLALAWLLNAEMGTNRRQRSQIAELTSKLADNSARERLELQQKCANQAEKIFSQQGYKLNGPRPASYQSHYNAKLNKCFMTLDSMVLGDQRFLFDAYEQREYAEYMLLPEKGKKYWEVQPQSCALIPSSADKSRCKSEEEYKAFVARYME